MLAVLALAALASLPIQRPALILFGGGWGPEGTQASIETHIGELMKALSPAHPRVLFASGDRVGRSVQIPAQNPDPIGELLGFAFDRRDHIHVDYRPTRLDPTEAATRNALLAALEETSRDEGGTIVLGAGHGAPAENNEPAALELWGTRGQLSVTDLAEELDLSHRKSPTAFVLGQCHSGAFVDLMYVAGDPTKPAADPVRCVLAAVPRDREASGCTADVQDPDARSYIAMIAEAFTQREESDLDRDGRVSLAEAHTYARIHDPTIDVPISSSEAWVRAALADRRPAVASWSFDNLLARARPLERAVIEALAPKRSGKPEGKESIATILAEIEVTNRRAEQLEAQAKPLSEERDQLRSILLDRLLARWPELANPYHAVSRRMLAGDAPEITAHLRAAPELSKIRALESKLSLFDEEIFSTEKKAARLERLVRSIELVVLETRLRRRRDSHVVRVLDKLLACEALAPM